MKSLSVSQLSDKQRLSKRYEENKKRKQLFITQKWMDYGLEGLDKREHEYYIKLMDRKEYRWNEPPDLEKIKKKRMYNKKASTKYNDTIKRIMGTPMDQRTHEDLEKLKNRLQTIKKCREKRTLRKRNGVDTLLKIHINDHEVTGAVEALVGLDKTNKVETKDGLNDHEIRGAGDVLIGLDKTNKVETKEGLNDHEVTDVAEALIELVKTNNNETKEGFQDNSTNGVIETKNDEKIGVVSNRKLGSNIDNTDTGEIIITADNEEVGHFSDKDETLNCIFKIKQKKKIEKMLDDVSEDGEVKEIVQDDTSKSFKIYSHKKICERGYSTQGNNKSSENKKEVIEEGYIIDTTIQDVISENSNSNDHDEIRSGEYDMVENTALLDDKKDRGFSEECKNGEKGFEIEEHKILDNAVIEVSRDKNDEKVGWISSRNMGSNTNKIVSKEINISLENQKDDRVWCKNGNLINVDFDQNENLKNLVDDYRKEDLKKHDNVFYQKDDFVTEDFENLIERHNKSRKLIAIPVYNSVPKKYTYVEYSKRVIRCDSSGSNEESEFGNVLAHSKLFDQFEYIRDIGCGRWKFKYHGYRFKLEKKSFNEVYTFVNDHWENLYPPEIVSDWDSFNEKIVVTKNFDKKEYYCRHMGKKLEFSLHPRFSTLYYARKEVSFFFLILRS